MTAQYDKAVASLSQILDIDPKNVRAYINSAVLYLSYLHDFQRAESLLKTAMTEIPNNLTIINTLAQLYIMDKKYELALKYANKVLELNPDDAHAYAVRGSVFFYRNRLNVAVEDLERSLRLDPKQKRVLNNLGVIYARKGNMEKAKLLWRESLKIDHDQPEIQNYLNN